MPPFRLMPPFRQSSARSRTSKKPHEQEAARARSRASKKPRPTYTRDLPDTQWEMIPSRIPPRRSGGDRRLPDWRLPDRRRRRLRRTVNGPKAGRGSDEAANPGRVLFLVYLALPRDPIAVAVVLSALIHRVAFGYSIIGKVAGSGILDVGPFEQGDKKASGDGTVSDQVKEATDRPAVEPWLPHQHTWSNVAVLGLVAGILGAFIAVQTESPFLAFGTTPGTAP